MRKGEQGTDRDIGHVSCETCSCVKAIERAVVAENSCQVHQIFDSFFQQELFRKYIFRRVESDSWFRILMAYS